MCRTSDLTYGSPVFVYACTAEASSPPFLPAEHREDTRVALPARPTSAPSLAHASSRASLSPPDPGDGDSPCPRMTAREKRQRALGQGSTVRKRVEKTSRDADQEPRRGLGQTCTRESVGHTVGEPGREPEPRGKETPGKAARSEASKRGTNMYSYSPRTTKA